MKKLMLTGFLMAATLAVIAQIVKTDTTAKKTAANGNNEIKINVFYTILSLPEITYERILNDESAAGISILFGIGDDTNFRFGAIPYYRVYFGAKRASGFFIEGNAALISTDEGNEYYFYDSTNGYQYSSSQYKQTSFGLGAAAGGKFLTKNGFIGEAYFGLGRLFGNKYNEVYPRMGITIGKRF